MTSTNSRPIFYGWYIVGIAFIANFMSTGVGFYIFNAFMKPLCDERGWTRADINLAPVIGGVVGLLGMLFYGTLVMRVGPRILMAIGAVISGVAFACLGQVSEIWHFYLFFILLFFGNGAMAGIVANTAVNNWFVLKRGKALGLATTGVSFSGAVLPFIAMILIERTDLAHAFTWIGVAIVAMAPVAWLVVRNRPEDHGMAPDGFPGRTVIEKSDEIPPADDPIMGGIEASGTLSLLESDTRLWTFPMVVRSPTFWKLGLVNAMAMMGVVAVMFQLAPRFEDIGFDKRSAMYMMSLTAFIGALGKYFWGMLCDRYDPRKVVAVLIVANGLGLGLGLIQNSFPALMLFIVIFGFAMGGVVSTGPITIAFLFGRDAYASVARFLGLVVRLQLIGYFITGLSYDRTGSYDTAYVIFIVLDLIAAALILTTKKSSIPLSKE